MDKVTSTVHLTSLATIDSSGAYFAGAYFAGVYFAGAYFAGGILCWGILIGAYFAGGRDMHSWVQALLINFP